MNKLSTSLVTIVAAIIIPTSVKAEPSFSMTERIDNSFFTTYCEQISEQPVLFSCTTSVLTVGESRVYNAEDTLSFAEEVTNRGGVIDWVTPPEQLFKKPHVGGLYGQN